MKLFRVDILDSFWLLAPNVIVAAQMVPQRFHGQFTLVEYPLDKAGWIPAHSSIEKYHFDEGHYIQSVKS